MSLFHYLCGNFTYMKKYQYDLRVADNVKVGTNTVLLTLSFDGKTFPDIVAGQFAELQAPSDKVLLRRPISIHDADPDNGLVSFLIQIVGEGSRSLAQAAIGQTVNAVLPLGNGFSYLTAHSVRPLLIGGGVGVAPLLLLGRRLSEYGVRPTFLFGARNAGALVRLDEFSRYGNVFVTTEDGSAGEKGFVTGHSLLLDSECFDRIYSCGPTPMMKAVAKWAMEHETPCEVSLEHKMACGIGACLCCVEDTADEGNVCVCKDGPVFPIERLKWLH